MHIKEFLSSDGVSINFEATHKSALLLDLAKAIAKSTCVSRDAIASKLAEREWLGGTGTGRGVAVPHARMPQILEPAAHFARLEKPIEFEAVDDLPVDLVFVLLLPASEDCRPLHALACVARKLRDEETLRLLRQAKDVSGLYDALIG